MSDQLQEDITLLKNELEELRFDTFEHEDAWEIGCIIREEYLERGFLEDSCLSIHMETMCGHILFRTKVGKRVAPDADYWIRGKINALKFTSQSSLLASKVLQSYGMENPIFGINDRLYHGGAFPITLKASSIPLAVIATSGLPDGQIDHDLIVAALRKYLGAKSG